MFVCKSGKGPLRGVLVIMQLINSELPSRDLVIYCGEKWGLPWGWHWLCCCDYTEKTSGGTAKETEYNFFLHAQVKVLWIFFGCSAHAGWHFSLILQPFNPRWLIISSLSFKGSHSTPLIYPHLPLMSFKRREIVALCNNPCCQSVLLKLHWLCGKLKINDLLARWGKRECVFDKEGERDWGMRALVCTYTLHSHLADH